MNAEHEQRDEQQSDMMRDEADRADHRDRDLEHFHQPNDARAFELVCELTRGGREQEKRQDEDTAGEIHQNARIEARRLCRLEREQQHHRVLEQVVVQRAEELRQKEGQKATGAQQIELVVRLVGRGRVGGHGDVGWQLDGDVRANIVRGAPRILHEIGCLRRAPPAWASVARRRLGEAAGTRCAGRALFFRSTVTYTTVDRLSR